MTVHLPNPADRTPASPALRLTRARVDYDSRAVFADLDLDLHEGTWTCVLGPSGIGKTTLLRLIAGLVPAAAGTQLVAADGRTIAGSVAFMAQQDLLLPWLSALDNVCLGARLRRQPIDRPAALSMLERVGAQHRADALPARLSGGERQRVALARTLMEDRPIVLMDEPFSALDAITRARLQDLAAELLGDRTVLLITHDPFEALRLGDCILVMSGRPARLSPALTPPGRAPREADDPRLAALHGQLLTRLRAAAESS